jgi:hypothetical protein
MENNELKQLDESRYELYEVCGEKVFGFKYEYCCNQFDCGCFGKPLEPCICSEKCWDIGLKQERMETTP